MVLGEIKRKEVQKEIDEKREKEF